jgi:hypothetical protein
MYKKRRSKSRRKSRQRSKSRRKSRQRSKSRRKSRQRSKSRKPARKSATRKGATRKGATRKGATRKSRFRLEQVSDQEKQQRKYLDERARGRKPEDFGSIFKISYIHPSEYDFAYFSVENLKSPDVDPEASELLSQPGTNQEKGEKIVVWLGGKIEQTVNQLIEKVKSDQGKYDVKTIVDDIDKQAENLSRNIYLYRHYEEGSPKLTKLRQVFDGMEIFGIVKEKFKQAGMGKPN